MLKARYLTVLWKLQAHLEFNGKNVCSKQWRQPSIHPSQGGWSLSQLPLGKRQATPWTGRQSITWLEAKTRKRKKRNILVDNRSVICLSKKRLHLQTADQFQNNVPQCKIVKTFIIPSSAVHDILKREAKSLETSLCMGDLHKNPAQQTWWQTGTILLWKSLQNHCKTGIAKLSEIIVWEHSHSVIHRCSLKLFCVKKKPYENRIKKYCCCLKVWQRRPKIVELLESYIRWVLGNITFPKELNLSSHTFSSDPLAIPEPFSCCVQPLAIKECPWSATFFWWVVRVKVNIRINARTQGSPTEHCTVENVIYVA